MVDLPPGVDYTIIMAVVANYEIPDLQYAKVTATFHPLPRPFDDSSTNITNIHTNGENTSNSNSKSGGKCPLKNPGQKLSYQFDTNNKPKDGTYLLCEYFKNGFLKHQKPYVNGVLHGLSKGYLGKQFKEKPSHRLKYKIEYKLGKRDGTYKYYGVDFISGIYFQEFEKKYVKGKVRIAAQYHDNTNIRDKRVIAADGVVIHTRYGRDGKMKACAKRDKEGKTTKCSK